MIIKNITLNNFFRFYGEIKINCSTDLDTNVTVIKGDNGTGKTIMLSAFHWAFYGELISDLKINEMLNNKKKNELKLDKSENTAEVSVKVELSDRGIDYAFLRTQTFEKNSDGNIVKKGNSEVIITNLSTKIPTIIQDCDFFENIIPKKLSGFFFFDGEGIVRLAEDDGKNEIRQAILDLLGLTNIKHIQDYLAPIKNDFTKELKRLSTNTETTHLYQQLEDITNKITEYENGLTEIKAQITSNQKTKAECEKFLKSNNAEHIKHLEEKREELIKEHNDITAKVTSDLSDILKHISKNFKTFLISDTFQSINDFLEDKRQKKQLPSDIKETFINDLLASKTCICGRPLLEGTPEYNRLIKLKETAGREELDNCYSRLRYFIDYSENKTIQNTFFTTIWQYRQKENAALERQKVIKKELNKISTELLSSDDELIAEREDLLQKTLDKLDTLKFKSISFEDKKKALQEEKKTTESNIKKALDKSKGASIVNRAFDFVIDLENLTTDINDYFIDITQQDMDAKLKDVFSIFARKQEREPVLSKDFELQIVNKETRTKVKRPSTGENQIISLSFIGAIVSYAKDKCNMPLMSDFSGGDYPIVMDSAFGVLDKTHKENIAKGIPALASQVIVIVSDEQWNGVVSDSMADKIGALYEMKDGYTTLPDSEYTEVRRVI